MSKKLLKDSGCLTLFSMPVTIVVFIYTLTTTKDITQAIVSSFLVFSFMLLFFIVIYLVFGGKDDDNKDDYEDLML